MMAQIWAHARSGDTYVVVVDDDDQIVEAAGPLHYSEILPALAGDFTYDPEVAEGIEATRDEYRVLDRERVITRVQEREA